MAEESITFADFPFDEFIYFPGDIDREAGNISPVDPVAAATARDGLRDLQAQRGQE